MGFVPRSRVFVGFSNTSVFCFAFPNITVVFTSALFRYLAWHCCWHQNFQLFTSILHDFLFRINEINTTNFFDIMSFCFSMVTFFFSSRFDASDICYHIFGHILWCLAVDCFLVKILSDNLYQSGGLLFSGTNVILVNASTNLFLPSTFQ